IAFPLIFWRCTQKSVGKEKTRKNAIGFARGRTGRRDSGVRRVDGYLGAYETIARIEKPREKLGSVFRAFTAASFHHFVHSLPSVFARRRLKILLAEDDDDLRALYGYMLAAAGYKVNAVRNGLEAFAETQVNLPDVIVTDIAMPVLNGLDLI